MISEREDVRTLSDGKVHTLRIIKFPIRDADGRLNMIGSIAVDVTQQISAQKALEEANARLAAASRAKSDFLAHMSHELRTPLNSVIGFSQMISEEHLGKLNVPQYLDYAELINSSAQHLLNVINDILDISKVEAGEMPIDREHLDVKKVIDDVVALMSHRAAERKVSVEIDVPADVARLYADERFVKQVLLNLISNSLKFTEAGGSLRIGVERLDDGSMSIRVEDTGIGIATEDIPRVLEPFGQVRRSANVAHGGTGLGLPLSQKLMELLGGTLKVESTLDVGTRVDLVFPAENVRSE